MKLNVNKGSDIYFTFMKDVKLIAFLMDKYNLVVINDVVPHHFFSGKDCPMIMKHSNMYQYIKDLALIEFKNFIIWKNMDFRLVLILIIKNLLVIKKIYYSKRFES